MREFMVAQIGHIIAQQVHRRDHRVQRPCSGGKGQSLPLTQGAALQKIAIVHQHATANLGPRCRDQAGGAGQSYGGIGAVFQIVP